MNNKLIVGIIAVLLVVVGVYSFRQGPNPEAGRVVVGIKDAAASIDNVTSILITVNKVEMESSSGGWVTVGSMPKQYDLLKLRDSGAISLYADSNIKAGTYNQIRLHVSRVVVIANGEEKEAKLPSGELKIVGKFVVNVGKTSTVVVDFLADKSLHVTGIGEFVFAPVIAVESRSEANVTTSGSAITIIGGKTDTSTTFGMDENGEIKSNFVLDQNARIDIVNGALKIMTAGETSSSIKVTAKSAVEAATMGGYIDIALSVKLTTKDGKTAWRVIGTKTLVTKIVYVDAVTGAILKVE